MAQIQTSSYKKVRMRVLGVLRADIIIVTGSIIIKSIITESIVATSIKGRSQGHALRARARVRAK
jgi:hypothetical protein